MCGHPKCFVIVFDMAYFAFWLSPISAQHIGKSRPEVVCDQWPLRKCPAHVVISNLFCATILHHFWEAASHFLRSVPVLSEDITANHRPKGPTLYILPVSCSPDNIMPEYPACSWEVSPPNTPSWNHPHQPPSPSTSAASQSKL